MSSGITNKGRPFFVSVLLKIICLFSYLCITEIDVLNNTFSDEYFLSLFVTDRPESSNDIDAHQRETITLVLNTFNSY